MAIVFSTLTSGSDGTDRSSYGPGQISSITPGANRLVLGIVLTSLSGGTPNQPTITGNSLTWVTPTGGSQTISTTNVRRITVFRAMGAAPTALAPTIDFAGQTQSNIVWWFGEATGIDTSGTNGSGAMGTIVINTGGGTSTSLTVTIPATPGDATFGTFALITNQGGSVTPGAGFTELVDLGISNNVMTLQAEWKNTLDTTVDISFTTSGVVGLAFPIIAAPAAPTVSNMSPTSGDVGTEVTFTGTNFVNGGTTVDFNGTSASVIFDSTSQIRATVPTGATTGTVTVTTAGGSANAGVFTVTVASGLVFTNLDAGTTPTDASSYTTASKTPTAGRWNILSITGCLNGGTPPIPTVSGCNLTWTLIDSQAYAATNIRRSAMYKGIGSSPTTGALTIDYGTGNVQNNFIWSWDQITGADPNDVQVQLKTHNSTTAGTGGATSFGVRMDFDSPFSNSSNGVIVLQSHNVAEASTPGGGFTELSDNTASNSVVCQQVQYIASNAQPASSWTTSAAWVGIAIEVRSFVEPNFTDFSPNGGFAGDSVVLEGGNFTGATAVEFNGTSASFVVDSATQITATVPVGATTGVVSVTQGGNTDSSDIDFIITTLSAPVSKVGNTTATLSWNYVVSDEDLITGFLRQSSSNPTTAGPWTDVETYPPTDRSATFTVPNATLTTYYRLLATRNIPSVLQFSPPYNIVTLASTLAPPPAEPLAPILSSVTSPSITSISWFHSNVSNETGYNYDTALSAVGPWTTRGSNPADSTAFTWTAASSSTTYFMRVSSIGPSGATYPSNVLSVTTGAAPPPEPTAPVLNSFTATSSTSIAYIYTNVNNETGYDIETSQDAMIWNVVGTNSPDVTSFTWNGAAASTFYYGRVSSFGASGLRYPSNQMSLTTPATPEPTAPTLTTVEALSPTSIRWNHTNVASEVGYNYDTSPDGATWTTRTTGPIDSTSATWNGATDNTAYFMRVVAIGPTTTQASNTLSLTTPTQPPPEPIAPTLNTFTSPDASTVTWSHTNVANEDGYDYETSPDGVTNWTLRGTSATNSTSFSWTGASPSTTYFGRVSSFGFSGLRYPSNVISVATGVGPPPPPPEPIAPNLTSVEATSPTQIIWHHTDVTNELGYNYETAPNAGGPWTVRTSAGPGSIQGIWNGATQATVYFMRVTAVGPSTSPSSNILSTTTPTAPPPEPTAPTLSTMTATAATSISFSWTNVSNETGYDIETSPDQVTWTLRGSVTANVLTFSWTGASASTLYYGRVSSFGFSGTRYPSNTLNATTPTSEPVAPVLLSAVVVSSTSILFTHTSVINATGYQYFANTELIGTSPSNATSFLWTGATPDTNYNVNVASVGQITIYGSNSITVTTPPTPFIEPSSPTLQALTATASSLIWFHTNVTDEVGYIYEVSANGIDGWVSVGANPSDSTQFMWTGANQNTTYFARVNSFGLSGTPHNSNVLSITTGTSPTPGGGGGIAIVAFNPVIRLGTFTVGTAGVPIRIADFVPTSINGSTLTFCTASTNGANDIIYIGARSMTTGATQAALTLKGPNQRFTFFNQGAGNRIAPSSFSIDSNVAGASVYVSIQIV